MKPRLEQAKVFMCLSWIVNVYDGIMREQGVTEGKSEHPEFDRFIGIVKEYFKKYMAEGWATSPKFRSAFVSFNRRLEKMHREISNDVKFYPVVVALGIMRHCPLDKIEGFDKLKDIDYQSMLEWARDNDGLKWATQKYCIEFKKFYWEV